MSRLTPTDLDDMRDDAAAVDAIYVSGGPVDHDTRVLAGHALELLDEVAALRAALDAIAAALRPALEAEAGAYPAPWTESGAYVYWKRENEDDNPDDIQVMKSFHGSSLALTVALRNALPAVRAELEKVKP